MCLYFFFQAEDGIRDRNVTGVQTCALPIFRDPHRLLGARGSAAAGTAVRGDREGGVDLGRRWRALGLAPAQSPPRSEERRVGKECRSRWAPDREKENRQMRYPMRVR